MNQNDWIAFLQENGAQIDNGLISHFGDATAESKAAATENCMSDLSPLGLIRVQGEDAATFLQNQLSNDIKDVSADRTQLSAYCSAKGRVLSLFRIIADGDDYLLQMPHDRVQKTLQRLSMFVLMSKVSLTDASSELCAIGISGPDAISLLKSTGLTSDLQNSQCFRNDQFIMVRLPGKLPRFTLIGRQEIIRTFWLANQEHFRPVAYSAWLAMDVIAGLPNVYEATCEAFVPQMLNLNSLDAISYSKGCYPGQEVVARMHYLGKQKRRMYLGHVNIAHEPKPGDKLFLDSSISEQSIGSVVHSAANHSGGYDVLAVIQVKHAENDKLFLSLNEDGPFIVKELPYTVELEGSQSP